MVQEKTIARPYAKAAFEFAHEHKMLSEWADMLTFAATVSVDRRMIDLIKNPLYTRAALVDLFLSVGKPIFSSPMQNFIRVLGEKKRLLCLPAISELYNELCAKAAHIVHATIIAAAPLSDTERETLTHRLAARFQSTVVIDTMVDKRILGGAIIRVGDWVMDGSLRGKLTQLCKVMGVSVF